MITQNNPQQPTGLFWVIFLQFLNPNKPKRTQKMKHDENRGVFGVFGKKAMPVGCCGMPEQKKEKKKEPKKKINKILGCWIKGFGFWIKV